MLKLTPKHHVQTERLLSQPEFVRGLITGLGSPLNILFPTQVQQSVRSFQEVFQRAGVQGKIYATHKPNKSQAIVQELARTNACIDVSSYGELVSALQAGFTGGHIGATGIKSDCFLRLALQHSIVIAVDSLSELKRVTELAASYTQEKVSILIRICDFSSTHTSIHWKDTRFGIRVKDFDEVIRWCVDHPVLNLKGVSFHLSEATQSEKVIAIENGMQCLIRAQSHGLSPNILNIGGGFRVSYLESASEWEAYNTAIKQSVLEGNNHLTWDKSGLGYRNECGVLRGASVFAESYLAIAGAQELEKLLNAPLPAYANTLFKQAVNDFLLELWIEPGRSVLDQVGLTAATVLGVKESAHGEMIVTLDMNRSNLNSNDLSILMDPTILYQNKSAESKEYGIFFGGNLCASDFLTRHKTFVDQLPEPGDVVVFHNTAGYLMDFAETHTHLHRVARKIALQEKGEFFTWSLDDVYESL